MGTLNQKLIVWRENFDALSLRERAVVVFAIIGISYTLWDFAIMKPLRQKQLLVSEQTQKTKNEINEVNKQIQAVTAQFNLVRQKVENGEVQSLKTAISTNNEQIESLIYDFIRPNQMATVLKELLDKEQGLKLMRLQTIGAKSLLDMEEEPLKLDGFSEDQYLQVRRLLTNFKQQVKQAQKNERLNSPELEKQQANNTFAAEDQNLPQIYKHGLEIEFIGDFPGTLRYLRSIEALPWRFYWDNVTYIVKQHPNSQVIIKIHTMSLDHTWIGV